MSEAWIEIEDAQGLRRVELGARGLVVGPAGSDVPLAATPHGRLRIALDPPSIRHEGSEEPPRRLARAWSQGALVEGDVLEWCGARLSVHGLGGAARAEPRAQAPTEPRAGARRPALASPESRALERLGRRIAAGVAVEIDLAPREPAREIQAEAVRGSFDPDGAAERLLEGVPLGDARLAARVATLERDLVLAPLQRGSRGALRKARTSVRSGLAGLIAQGLALLALSGILLAVLVLSRARWDFSVDLWLDRILGRG